MRSMLMFYSRRDAKGIRMIVPNARSVRKAHSVRVATFPGDSTAAASRSRSCYGASRSAVAPSGSTRGMRSVRRRSVVSRRNAYTAVKAITFFT